MKLNLTSGLVLLLVGIFITPVAILSFRALNSPTEPSTAPTTQIRLLDSPLARVTYSKSKPKPRVKTLLPQHPGHDVHEEALRAS